MFSVGILFLLTLAVLFVATNATVAKVTVDDFKMFKNKYKVTYSSPEEESLRLQYFLKNVQEAYERNATEPYAIFGITKFSDRSPEEWRAMSNLNAMQAKNIHINDIKGAKTYQLYSQEEVDSKLKGLRSSNGAKVGTFDWRNNGVVTEVKNQGGCGSCWTFGTIGSVEATNVFAGRPLTSYSEEELLNCCNRDNQGGGPYCGDWIARNGINTLQGYPYYAGTDTTHCYGTCDNALADVSVGRIAGITCIPNDESRTGVNEQNINLYMQMSGPMITSIAASGLNGYIGGIIINGCREQEINHTVLIVGQGEENGIQYWIVKNSWGVEFGEGGYFRMQYGVCCMSFCAGGNCQTHN